MHFKGILLSLPFQMLQTPRTNKTHPVSSIFGQGASSSRMKSIMTKKINAFLKNAHTKRENKQKQRQLEKKIAIILKCERVVLLPPLLKNNVLCIFVVVLLSGPATQSAVVVILKHKLTDRQTERCKYCITTQTKWQIRQISDCVCLSVWLARSDRIGGSVHSNRTEFNLNRVESGVYPSWAVCYTHMCLSGLSVSDVFGRSFVRPSGVNIFPSCGL